MPSQTHLHVGHYKLLHVLGYGAFGKVKLAEDTITGLKVAVKIISKARIKSLDMMEKASLYRCERTWSLSKAITG
jgi:serine/threonine protein kinase